MGKDDPPPYSPYGNQPQGAPPAGFQPQSGYPPPPQPGYPQPGYPSQPQPGYPQPQPGYPSQPHPGYPQQPQPGFPQTTTNVVTVTQVTPVNLGPDSVTTVCPSCHHHISTTVESKATTKTHLFALLLCLFGCWPCFCLPYCMDSCQGQSHTCPNCGTYLGTYEG